jgi:hypothetical protein
MDSAKLARMSREWDKRGYYRVGDQKFYNKAQAILACQRIRPEHWPDFIFNDDIFCQSDWSQEPQESLTEIYRQRALQLREKYDHLVLSYSSGSDSTNILQNFLFNNIKLDEVFCFGPFSTTQGRVDTLTRSAENNFREIDLVAMPYLRELSKKYNFKVTLYDWTQDMAKGFRDEDWIWTESQSRLSPSIVVRNRLHNARSHLNLVDQGKKVGFIFGIDKPKIILKNGVYYLAFIDLDLNMGVGPGALMTGSEWEHDEYFYWTPDLPKLVIKQAHILKKFFESHPGLKYCVENSDQAAWAKLHKTQYLDIVKRLMYPGFNADVWQTNKISSLTYTEHDNWFIKDSTLTANQIWQAGLRTLQKTLDPKFFNGGKVDNGYVGTWSKWHKIG